MEPTLLVGFDSAWTANNCGAIVGVLQSDNGGFRYLGEPQIVDYRGAEATILSWHAEQMPAITILMLDQPTIVKNPGGQRPVESIVASAISRRNGGMQPANTGKQEMFGQNAPVWPFLGRFGGPGDPHAPIRHTRVFETYPALALIALGWTQLGPRPIGRLPKYNPARKKSFSISDWHYVCKRLSCAFRCRELNEIADWIDDAAGKIAPRKCDQDGLDACICLLVAVYLAEGKDCLIIGDLETGYIVVPHSDELYEELHTRCKTIGRVPSAWLQVLKLDLPHKHA